MAAPTDKDNDIITSFSNPNYELNNVDALNSNIPTQYYDENMYENGDFTTTNSPKTNSSTKRRKKYANMDLSSMGIDPDNTSLNSMEDVGSPESLVTPNSEGMASCDSAVVSPMDSNQGIMRVQHTETPPETDDDNVSYTESKPKGFLGYYASLELSAKARQNELEAEEKAEAEKSEKEEKDETDGKSTSKETTKEAAKKSFDEKSKDINSPDSNDSGIQADVQQNQGPVNNDIYAEEDKKKINQEENENETSPTNIEVLPPGWERHEDEDGPYYWHIKSGTIQRDPPPPPTHHNEPGIEFNRSTSSSSETSSIESSNGTSSDSSTTLTPTSSGSRSPTNGTDHLQAFEGHAFKQDSKEKKKEKEKPGDAPIRFAVRSLGWVRIAEEDLTPERSSKAVNKCIVDLSLGRNDINDVVGRWGDGKDLYMDLDNETLSLTDPQDMSLLNVQPIHTIRVWGVGRDNGRDFAYVARDRITRRHMCHVFRCDTPARQIANTLRDICRKIMMQRSIQQSLQANSSSMQKMTINRPNNLPNLEKAGDAQTQKVDIQSLYRSTSFPTPMEEPKKVLRCHYLGTAVVNKPGGIEVLNGAMEKVHAQVPPEKWVFTSVAVAPSTITIAEHGKPDNVLAECRVRFLSFMGIAMRNVKLCAFIMHTAQNNFIAHVFHAEPSAGALCKTIEAACKLRYQKCLDAHPQTPDPKKQQNPQQNKNPRMSASFASLKAGVQTVFDKIKKKTEYAKVPTEPT